MWILFAFGSALFAGATAVLAKIGVKKVDSMLATAIRTVIILIFSWLMVFIVGSWDTILSINPKSYVFLILSGLATGASWLCYFKALQLGDVNKVTPIDKFSTVLTMIMAFIILGEPITLAKSIGITSIALGTYLMVANKKMQQEQSTAGTAGSAWLIYAILSAVFASLTAILAKIGIVGIESNLGTAIRTVVVLIMAWLMVFITHKHGGIKEIDRKSWIFLWLSGITTGLSWLCYYKALQDGQASIVVPIDKLSIVITVAFSYFFLKEKVTAKSFMGLILIVAGTMTLLLP
nr:MAG: multidrug DMT transporter permease [Caldicoprobacter oshimai]